MSSQGTVMKPPFRTAPTPHASPLPPADALTPQDAILGRFRIDYHGPLRWQRVNALRLRIDAERPVGGVPPAGEPLLVRAVIPGCQVIPQEVSLDPSRPEPVTLHVTPLARGDLREARLELYRAGQRLPDCVLRLRSVTTRNVGLLAGLALVVPIVWLYLTTYSGLTTPPDTAASAGPLATVLGRHLPPLGPVTAAVATGLQYTLDALGVIEQTVRFGFLLVVVLAGTTVMAALAHRTRAVSVHGPTILLGVLSASARLRRPPSYLTPVPPEEIGRINIG
jgi:hypothetical protein